MRARLVSLCLALAMLATLAGCGPAEPDVSDGLTDDELLDTLPGQWKDNQDSRPQSTYTPNGTVLLDDGSLKITVEDLRVHEYGGIDVDLFLENTGSQNMTLSATNCSVNGYMASVSFYCDVSAQKAAEETLTLYISDVATELGLIELADLSVSFSIDTPDGGRAVTAPCTLTTPKASLCDYSSVLLKALRDPNWIIGSNHQLLHAAVDPLYDRDGLSAPVACLVKNAFEERELYLEFYNSAADKALVELGDVSLNGAVVSDGTCRHYSIEPGKRHLTTINLDDLGDCSQLQEIGFTLNGEAVTISLSA